MEEEVPTKDIPEKDDCLKDVIDLTTTYDFCRLRWKSITFNIDEALIHIHRNSTSNKETFDIKFHKCLREKCNHSLCNNPTCNFNKIEDINNSCRGDSINTSVVCDSNCRGNVNTYQANLPVGKQCNHPCGSVYSSNVCSPECSQSEEKGDFSKTNTVEIREYKNQDNIPDIGPVNKSTCDNEVINGAVNINGIRNFKVKKNKVLRARRFKHSKLNHKWVKSNNHLDISRPNNATHLAGNIDPHSANKETLLNDHHLSSPRDQFLKSAPGYDSGKVPLLHNTREVCEQNDEKPKNSIFKFEQSYLKLDKKKEEQKMNRPEFWDQLLDGAKFCNLFNFFRQSLWDDDKCFADENSQRSCAVSRSPKNKKTSFYDVFVEQLIHNTNNCCMSKTQSKFDKDFDFLKSNGPSTFAHPSVNVPSVKDYNNCPRQYSLTSQEQKFHENVKKLKPVHFFHTQTASENLSSLEFKQKNNPTLGSQHKIKGYKFAMKNDQKLVNVNKGDSLRSIISKSFNYKMFRNKRRLLDSRLETKQISKEQKRKEGAVYHLNCECIPPLKSSPSGFQKPFYSARKDKKCKKNLKGAGDFDVELQKLKSTNIVHDGRMCTEMFPRKVRESSRNSFAVKTLNSVPPVNYSVKLKERRKSVVNFTKIGIPVFRAVRCIPCSADLSENNTEESQNENEYHCQHTNVTFGKDELPFNENNYGSIKVRSIGVEKSKMPIDKNQYAVKHMYEFKSLSPAYYCNLNPILGTPKVGGGSNNRSLKQHHNTCKKQSNTNLNRGKITHTLLDKRAQRRISLLDHSDIRQSASSPNALIRSRVDNGTKEMG